MRITLKTLSALTVVVLVGMAANMNRAPAVDATVGDPAPAFTLVDTYGNQHTLSDFEGKYVVLEWLNFGCPFVGKHYGGENMQALQKTYTERDVVWLSVVSSREGKQGYYPPDEMNAQMEERGGTPTAILMDTDGTVGRAYGARTTPQMFVIGPEGTLLYNGAIDNKPTTNKEDLKTAENYVVAALDAAMNGEEIAVKTSQPYGCDVKY